MAKPNRVQRTSRNKATQTSRDAKAKDTAKQPVDSSIAEDTENVETAEVEDTDVEPATDAEAPEVKDADAEPATDADEASDKGASGADDSDDAGAGSTAVGAKAAKEKADGKSKTTSAKKETSAKKDSASKTSKSASSKDGKNGKNSKGSADDKDSNGEAKKSSAKRTSRSGNPAKRASGRKTSTYSSADHGKVTRPNPRWFLPVMLGILLLGLAWLIVFYISSGKWPVEAWGNWNLLVGFGIMVVGLGMSTRWR